MKGYDKRGIGKLTC